MGKQQLIESILQLDATYLYNDQPLPQYAETATFEQLQAIYDELFEQHLLARCQHYWWRGEQQRAYNLFLLYEDRFQKKIRLAALIIDQFAEVEVDFFKTTKRLHELNPIELSLYYPCAFLYQFAQYLQMDYETPQQHELQNALARTIMNLVQRHHIVAINEPVSIDFANYSVETMSKQYDAETLQHILQHITHVAKIKISKEQTYV